MSAAATKRAGTIEHDWIEIGTAEVDVPRIREINEALNHLKLSRIKETE